MEDSSVLLLRMCVRVCEEQTTEDGKCVALVSPCALRRSQAPFLVHADPLFNNVRSPRRADGSGWSKLSLLLLPF